MQHDLPNLPHWQLKGANLAEHGFGRCKLEKPPFDRAREFSASAHCNKTASARPEPAVVKRTNQSTERQSMTDKPSVDETYSRAGNTSNLTVEADRRGDADVLIAAGMVGASKSLGMALLRLHSEYDGASRLREDATMLDVAMRLPPGCGDCREWWAL